MSSGKKHFKTFFFETGNHSHYKQTNDPFRDLNLKLLLISILKGRENLSYLLFALKINFRQAIDFLETPYFRKSS